jgi:hypothetical protein
MSARTRGVAAGVGGGIAAVMAIAAIIAAVAGIGALIWWFGVRTSATAGTGNITKDQNSSQNREYWSTQYAADLQKLQADQNNLVGLKQYATAPGATQQDKQNLEGAQQNCASDVATYNTDAANILGRQWLPTAQPANVTAYCKG